MAKKQNHHNQESLHAARLAAVQALYQIEQIDADPKDVIKEFIEHRLLQAPEHEHDILVDLDLFKSIVTTFFENSDIINKKITETLIEGWTLHRLESILRVVLQAGCAEFALHNGAPAKVIINEYVEVTKDFYGGKEPAFVNGVLDHVARGMGLELTNGDAKAPAKIKNFLKEREKSGVPNWEGEGGSA